VEARGGQSPLDEGKLPKELEFRSMPVQKTTVAWLGEYWLRHVDIHYE
jgi:hypothetical protein